VTAVLREAPGAVDEAGRPAGGRFAPRAAPSACSSVYAALDAWAAAAVPEEGEVLTDDGVRVTFHRERCPHGSFRAWADAVAPGCKFQRNCRSCHPPRRSLRRGGEER
jgi:hypothetical protein